MNAGTVYRMNKDSQEDLNKIIKLIEGFSNKVYLCSEGHLTVGWGHLLSKDDLYCHNLKLGSQVDDVLLEKWFEEDTKSIHKDAEKLPYYADLPDDLKVLVLYLIYNIGISRFKGFKKFIKLLKNVKSYAYNHNFGDAQVTNIELLVELCDSKWAVQVPRAARILTNYLLNQWKIDEKYMLLKDLNKSALYWWSQNKDRDDKVKGTANLLRAAFFYTSIKDIDNAIKADK